MILIADSGSTKTDWIGCSSEGEIIFSVKTIGLNPYNTPEETIRFEIENNLLSSIDPQWKIHSIFFYGSGCASDSKQTFLHDILQSYFPHTSITIEHDMMGAARACCGRDPGLVAILGTGSNSCVFDGENITHNIPSLGYVLCDEGAGTNIGKLLLTAYLRFQMPADISAAFAQQYPGSESDFLDNLYNGPQPNSYLASFASFSAQYKDHPYVHGIVKEAFQNFFDKQIKQYPDYLTYPLNSIGSIGFHFSEILSEVASEEKIKMGNIISSPIDALVAYHTQKVSI